MFDQLLLTCTLPKLSQVNVKNRGRFTFLRKNEIVTSFKVWGSTITPLKTAADIHIDKLKCLIFISQYYKLSRFAHPSGPLRLPLTTQTPLRIERSPLISNHYLSILDNSWSSFRDWEYVQQTELNQSATLFLACENIRFSALFTTGDVLCGYIISDVWINCRI